MARWISSLLGCYRPGPILAWLKCGEWVYSATARLVMGRLWRRVTLRRRLGAGRRVRAPNGYLWAREQPCRHLRAVRARRRVRRRGKVPAWSIAGYPLWKGGRRSCRVYGP
jgi:hypothetical protein